MFGLNRIGWMTGGLAVVIIGCVGAGPAFAQQPRTPVEQRGAMPGKLSYRLERSAEPDHEPARETMQMTVGRWAILGALAALWALCRIWVTAPIKPRLSVPRSTPGNKV